MPARLPTSVVRERIGRRALRSRDVDGDGVVRPALGNRQRHRYVDSCSGGMLTQAAA